MGKKGRFSSFPSPSPSFFFFALVSFLARSKPKVPSSVFLCSETKRKRLLRRLAFLYISLLSLHDYDVKIHDKILFLFLNCAPSYFSLQSYRTRNLSTRAAKPLCRKKRGKELTPYYWTVWSNCSQTNLDELFKLQKRCARLILDILRDARSYDNFQKLKWLPLDQLFKLNKLGLLTKVINWW